MDFSLAALAESSANWMERQREALDEINSARTNVELAIARRETAKAKVKTARLAYQQAQMTVYYVAYQGELKRIKALLALRNAELKAVRAELDITKAYARLDAAYWQMDQVDKGEGFALAA